jgi:poly(3-hydroxybutyrate) depolymerase
MGTPSTVLRVNSRTQMAVIEILPHLANLIQTTSGARVLPFSSTFGNSTMLATAALLATLASPILAIGSNGCGQSPPHAPGTTAQYSISSSGGNRTFLVHLPQYYTGQTATPLLFSFHGHERDAPSQEHDSQMSNETFNPNTIAVYPQGVNVM